MKFRFFGQKQGLVALKFSLPLILSLTPLISGVQSSAFADDLNSALWAPTYQQGADALKAGDFQLADQQMQKAYDMAKTFAPTDVRLLSSLDGLALAQSRAQKYSEAEKTFEKALAFKSKMFGEHDPEMAKTRANMAANFFAQDRFKQADAFFRGAIADLAPDSPVAMEASFNLAVCLSREGKYDESANNLASVVERFKTAYGPQSIQLVYARLAACDNKLQRGDFSGGLSDIENLLNEPDGLANPKVDSHLLQAALAKKAVCLMELGRYKESEVCNKTILDLVKTRDGEQSESYGNSLYRLALLELEEQKYKESEKHFSQAREIIDKKFKGLTTQAGLFANLAKLQIELGRYDKAEELLKTSIDITSQALGARHPDVAEALVELAYVQAQKNHLSDAENSYKLALSIDEESVGKDVPPYSKALSRLGELYALENKIDDAEKVLKEALALREHNLPPGHKDIARSMKDLADLYQKHSLPTKAETMYRRMVSFDDKYNSDKPALKVSSMDGLEAAIRAQGKTDYADGIASETAALKKKIPGFQVIELAGGKTSEQPPLKVVDEAVGDKWALCVGISSFQDQSINLKYAAKDATDFSNFLVARGNFPKDHVQLLTDEKASRENILAELGEKWLGHKVKKNDLVVIYISSHGSQSMQAANNTNFLVAYDTNKDALLSTGIPMQWLTQIIKEQVPSDRILLVLDVCHSGSVVEGEKGLVRHDNVDVSKVAPTPGQIVVCSSSADQVSWESKEYPNSVFTRRLIEALDSKGASTTLTDAYKLMKTNVEEEVLRDRQTLQNPALKQSFQGSNLKPLAAASAN